MDTILYNCTFISCVLGLLSPFHVNTLTNGNENLFVIWFQPFNFRFEILHNGLKFEFAKLSTMYVNYMWVHQHSQIVKKNNCSSVLSNVFLFFVRLNCGVTALFGLMMECVGLETVVSVNAQIMSSLNHSRSLTVDFLQIIWYVKKENHRLLLIKPWTARFSKDGVKLTIHGHLMMRLIIVIYFVFDLLYCTLFVFSLITSITVIKLLHPFQMRWLMWIFNWILNVTLAILVIQLEGYGTLFTKKIVQNVCIRAPKLVCICLFCLIILIWSTMLSAE